MTVNPAYRCVRASVTIGLLVSVPGVAWAQEPRFDLEGTLARVGEQLTRRYQRSQRIVATEMASVRSFDYSMRSETLPQRLEYEHRLEWATAETGVPTVTMFRDLRSVNGREPQPRDLDGCVMPPSETEDPLAALLPARQTEFDFVLGALERVDGRRVARLDYAPLEEGPAEVIWEDECVSLALPGWSRGQVWVDLESGDVLRLDQRLRRRFDFREPQDRRGSRPGWITLERNDVTIHYHRVTFEDPAETLLLPQSIERSWSLRGSGITPRYFVSQQFSDYRRFLTEGRLVEAPRSGRETTVR